MAIDSPREVGAENRPDLPTAPFGYNRPHFGPPGSAPYNTPRLPFPRPAVSHYDYSPRAVAKILLAEPRLTEHQVAADFGNLWNAAKEADRQRDLARAAELGVPAEEIANGALYRAGIGRQWAVEAFERAEGTTQGPMQRVDDLNEQTERAEADFYAARAGHGHDLMSLSQETTQALGPMFREQGTERDVARREQIWQQAQGQDEVMRVAGLPEVAPGQERPAGSSAGAELGQPAAHHRTPATVAPREPLHKD